MINDSKYFQTYTQVDTESDWMCWEENLNFIDNRIFFGGFESVKFSDSLELSWDTVPPLD